METNKVREHLGFPRGWGWVLTLVVIVSLVLLAFERSQIAMTIMFVVCLGFLVATWVAAIVIFDQANDRTRAAERQISFWATQAYLGLYTHPALLQIYYRATRRCDNKRALSDAIKLEELRHDLGEILKLTDPEEYKRQITQARLKLQVVATAAEADRQKKKEPN